MTATSQCNGERRMRLSEAIELGRHLVELNPTIYLSRNRCIGCLIGMGMVAAGIKHVPGHNEYSEYWPWITDEIDDWISGLAHKVESKEITMDEAIRLIREMEPSPAPYAVAPSAADLDAVAEEDRIRELTGGRA